MAAYMDEHGDYWYEGRKYNHYYSLEEEKYYLMLLGGSSLNITRLMGPKPTFREFVNKAKMVDEMEFKEFGLPSSIFSPKVGEKRQWMMPKRNERD
ncbi:hypothetical protein [Metabacillus fastidiosus]|uniref:hypothetical protein n=1 Tax=Metabacillus fastidiosus TaxID=1458 RepID=UPI002E203E10|nr:hypothetical protein [Metabacillus fastidiosus]